MSEEENKAIVRRVEEAWSANRLDELDALFEPNFKQYNAVPNAPAGLQGAKMAHQMSMQSFPDRRTTIEDILAEGDQVAVRVRLQGTNQGGVPWMGVPGNNSPVDIEWISIYRLANGKIIEHRAVMDLLGMMQQLGALPSPEQAPSATPA